MTEEERAALFCDQQKRRAEAERARRVALAGNPAARKTLQDNWLPKLAARADGGRRPTRMPWR